MHTAETGRIALEVIAANAHVYALCLIDTVLPDIDSLSLCSQMSELVRRRSREAEAPAGAATPDVRPLPLFLMESSEGAGPPRAKVIEMGGEDLIVKPVARASLRALVARTKVEAAVGPGRCWEDLVIQRMLNPGVLSQMASYDVFLAMSAGPWAPAPPAAPHPHSHPHPGLQPQHGRPVPPSRGTLHWMPFHSRNEGSKCVG